MPQKQLMTRTLTASPETYKKDDRCLRAIATTEQPARVWDWERFDLVDEVLRMDGLELPASGQVPLLDSHNRHSVADVIGHAKEFDFTEAAGFKATDCLVTFADTAAGRDTEKLFADGHLTDFSIGYEVKASEWIPVGQKKEIAGQEYAGPLKVATAWKIKELSATPIGADDLAKARSEHINKLEGKDMPQNKIENGQTSPETRAQEKKEGLTPEQAKQAAQDAVRAERERAARIRANVKAAGLDEQLADELIEQGKSLGDAAQEIFARMAETNKPVSVRIEAGETERDKFRGAVEDGLQAFSGLGENFNEFSGKTLVQIAEQCVARSGVNTSKLSNDQIIARATTSDFPYILANTANKQLQAAYQANPTTYQQWCAIGSVTDFKSVSRPQISDLSTLPTVPEGAEYKLLNMSEFAESIAAVAKGGMISFSRQAIVNDDRSAFTSIPRKLGYAAAGTVNAMAYAVLTGNQTMAYDSTALFHADHSNLKSSGGGAPSTTTLGAARAAMRKQTGPQGTVLNVIPRFLIVPAALETGVEVLLRSTALPDDSKNANTFNPFRGNLTPVVEPLLDSTSATAWYLAASSSQIDTVEVVFRNGVRIPTIEEDIDFNTGGWSIKATLDVGVRALDHRGMYKNVGA